MLDDLVDALDDIPTGGLILADVGVGLFVLMAHGGYLLASVIHGQPVEYPQLLVVTLSAAVFVILISIPAALSEHLRLSILGVHAVLFAVAAAALFAWAVKLLAFGIDAESFTWTPGLLTAFCVYPVYLLRRTVLSRYLQKSRFLKYSHLVVLVVVLPVDIGVFWSLFTTLGNR